MHSNMGITLSLGEELLIIYDMKLRFNDYFMIHWEYFNVVNWCGL